MCLPKSKELNHFRNRDVNCIRHRDKPAAFFCPNCDKHVCEICVHIKGNTNTRIECCPFCDRHLTAYEAPRKRTTIMERIKDTFSRKAAEQSPDEKAWQFLEQAQSMRGRREQEAALELYRQAIELAPEMMDALEEYFQLLGEMNRREEAVEAGLAFLKQCVVTNDSLRGLRTYRRIISVQPKADPGVESLAVIAGWFYDIKALAESATVWRKLAVLYPDGREAAHALFRSAFILDVDLGKQSQAKKIYEFLIQRHPQSEYVERAKAAVAEAKNEAL